MKELILIDSDIRYYKIIDPNTGETLVSGGPYRSPIEAKRRLLMRSGSHEFQEIKDRWGDTKIIPINDSNKYEYFALIKKIIDYDDELFKLDIQTPVHKFRINDITEIEVAANTHHGAWAELFNQLDYTCYNIEYLGEQLPIKDRTPPIYKNDISEQFELPLQYENIK